MPQNKQSKVTDSEVRSLILDGGQFLADHAIEQWASGKHTPYPMSDEDRKMQSESIARWRSVKDRMCDAQVVLKRKEKEEESDED